MIHEILQPKIVRVVHHLLIAQSIWVTQDHSWPVVVLTSTVDRILVIRVKTYRYVLTMLFNHLPVKSHMLRLSGKEHQRNLMPIITLCKELHCVVIVRQNIFKLLKITKDWFSKATSLLHNLCGTGVDKEHNLLFQF